MSKAETFVTLPSYTLTNVSANPLLQAAAVEAARGAKFKLTVVDGKPVKVSGLISYVFTLDR